jgi:tripartite-type tricarboxylate transporter receptor subunit TctC
MKRWWAACVFAIGALVVNAAAAAVPYPNRPVRLIVPSGAGGITDIIGRNIADRLTTNLGQQVIVDNRPGASGIVGSLIVAKAPPDGHTLLMAFPSHPVNPSLYPDIPFDTERAFAPITLVSAVAPVLIVSAQFPARSVQDLIAIAKAKPGQLNHGSVGRGSMGSLAAELLRTTAGIRFQQVAYKGAPQALTAVMGGEVDFYLIGSAGTVVPHVQAGRLRALGVGVRERISVLPDVPPIADAVMERHPRSGRHAARDRRPSASRDRENRARTGVRENAARGRRHRRRQHAGRIRGRHPQRRCEVAAYRERGRDQGGLSRDS